MAKKKTKMPKPALSNDFEDAQVIETTADDEYLALCLTLMLKEVNPLIDEGASFEIILTMLVNPWDELSAIEYGAMIRSTMGAPQSNRSH